MKYRNIILLGFLMGCLLSFAGLIFIQEQRPEPMPPHRGNDMEGVAYALAVGFNIVLALTSLPVLLISRHNAYKIILGAILLFLLPLTFTVYIVIALDAYALLYCIPYLASITVLLLFRIKKNKPNVS